MAIPNTIYAKSTVAQTPSASLTDFTFLVDLSQIPQLWWDEVDTSDGARGRVAKDDGTELASDWIDFDDVAQTGWVRIKWSGTSSGSETIQIYPPQAANDSYLASATFGAYNAYGSTAEYYSPDGGAGDRTSNQVTATTIGTPTTTTGKVGAATDYAGSNMYTLPSSVMDAIETSAEFTMSGWVYLNDVTTADNNFMQVNDQVKVWQDVGGSGDGWAMAVWEDASTFTPIVGADNNDASVDTWQRVSFIWDGATIRVFVNGVQTASGSKSSIHLVSETIGLGGEGSPDNNPSWDGLMDDIVIYSEGKSVDWEEYEYEQSNNNSTFWGTWSISFQNISPADGATGVSVTPAMEWADVDDHNNYNLRLSLTDFGDAIRDIFTTLKTETIADALDALTSYYWNVRKYTPGGLVDAFLYEEYFETAQSGWDGWLTTQMQGAGSFSHTGGQGVVTADAGGQVGAVLDVNFSDIDENFVIEFTDVTTNLQPTIHFRTQGTTWIGNFIPGYYIYFLGDEVRIGRVTEAGNPSDYSEATNTFARTADTKYRCRIFTEDYRLRFAIWPVSGSQDGWTIDYTDGSQRYASGGLAVKNAAVTTSASMAFDYITVEGAQVEQEPQSVDSVTVSPTSATIQPDSTTLITGDIQTSGGLSNAGTWTKVSGDADLTIQSQSNNNLTVASSASASDTDSAVFELTADEDGTMSAQTTVTVSDVAVTGSRAGDEAALEALWGSTSGWVEDQNWGANMSLSNDIWGIGVETLGGELRVVHMDLQRGTKIPPTPASDPTDPFPGNEISGTLPSEIGNLTEIRYCNLKQNAFVGTLPSSMTNWSKCERLLIGGHTREPKLNFYNHPTGGGVSGQAKSIYTTNKFSGTLPDIFGSMTSLEVFESQGHAHLKGKEHDPDAGWEGAIPNNWPSSLQMLFLAGNKFTGNIPIGLTTTNLSVLHLYFNLMSGDLLPELGNLSGMTHCRLGDNSFTSDGAWTYGFPDEWAGFQNLRLLTLEFNNLSGSIPEFLFDGRNNWTEGFRVEFNNFEGEIPANVNTGDYPNWNVFSLSYNNFSGPIPDWIPNLRWIQLNLEHNSFSGDLPSGFHDSDARVWRRLRNLYMQNNSFTGQMPQANPGPSIWNYYLDNNNFTGTFSSEFGDSTTTRALRVRVRNNNLSGYVYPNIADITNLSELFLSNNNYSSADLEDISNAIDPSVDFRT